VKNSVLIFLVFILTLGMTSCEKDPETVPEGTVRLFINVNHHGFPIANARLFRKDGATTWPGTDTSLYDTRYTTDANGNLTINGIGNGTKEFVLYAIGVDASWDSTGTTFVHGYQMFHIVTAIGESKDITAPINVSE
jgi:hypothetical protein